MARSTKSYEVYVDDDYSGLKFDRLERNYIETGYYTEHYFKDVGVRYIEINKKYK